MRFLSKVKSELIRFLFHPRGLRKLFRLYFLLCEKYFPRNRTLKRVLVHVGQHKTGSTSTQNFIKKYWYYFVANGYYHPIDVGGVGGANHYALNIVSLDPCQFSSRKDSFIKREGVEAIERLKIEVLSSLDAAVDKANRLGCHTMTLSNEGLYLLRTREENEKFFQMLKKYNLEVVVVCCFRQIDRYKNSYRNQLKKEGLAYSEDPSSYRYIKDDSWVFNFEQKKTLLSDVYDDCIFFNYSSEDNISEFMNAIDLYNPFNDNLRSNITPSEFSKS